LFGTRCRTESFAYTTPNAGTAQYIHYEAYRERPDSDSWTVRRILQTARASGAASVHAEVVYQRLNFSEALALLVKKEANLRQDALSFSPVYPDAAAMGFAHFRNFAEREGYVFDAEGHPHPRPGPGLLPSGVTINADAADRADKHLQRPEAEFEPFPPSRRLPDTLFIFDAFNRRAIGKNHASELAGLRVLNLMDNFVNSIERMNRHLAEYAHAYRQPGAATQISQAEAALALARNQLRQIGAYGVDVGSFDKMADECAIIVSVMHAQGLYDRMRHSPGGFDALEEEFKKRTRQAIDAYGTLVKKYNVQNADEGRSALQEMILQGGAPALPQAIADFVARYRQQRSAFVPQPKHGHGGSPKP
jgi:hypothetical protein